MRGWEGVCLSFLISLNTESYMQENHGTKRQNVSTFLSNDQLVSCTQQPLLGHSTTILQRPDMRPRVVSHFCVALSHLLPIKRILEPQAFSG